MRETHTNPSPAEPDPNGLQQAWEKILVEVGKQVVAQQTLTEQLMIALLSGGHCLFVGMPGMARALTASALGQALGLDFHRIRCTPDLCPQDITDVERLDTDISDIERKASGLLFANILFVDNLALLPPRTQGVLQQAIQDREVVVRGQRQKLPNPFLLAAARFPEDDDELDLPYEPHDDRFLLAIRMRYPDYHDEYEIGQSTTLAENTQPKQILSAAEILLFQQKIRQVEPPPATLHYVLRLVRATRVHEGENPDFVYEWLQQGAGPRAVQHLVLAAKARAALHGRSSVTIEDIRALAHPILRHRIVTNRNARTNGITADRVIDRLLHDVPERVDGDDKPPSPGESPVADHWSPKDVLNRFVN